MKLRRLAATAAASAMALGGTLGFASAASANPRCTDEVRVVGRQVVTVGVNPAQFHVDVRKINGTSNLWSIWVYHETNNIGGLQRGATSYPDQFGVPLGPWGDEACEPGPSDTVVI